MRLLWTAACVAAASVATSTHAVAQEVRLLPLPSYAALNPTVAARSGLSAEPYRERAPGWRASLTVEYGSAAEVDIIGRATYVLDAELMRAQLTATRDVARQSFVLLQAGVTGAYAGFADGFFDSYHRLIGYKQPARLARPRNSFAYRLSVPGGPGAEYAADRLALDDVRVGVGVRLGERLQSLLSVTLPTAPARSAFGRGVPSVSMVSTYRAPAGGRMTLEGGAGAGYTPRHGELAAVQRELFLALFGGARLRVWRAHSLYGRLYYHSPVYRGLTLPELVRGERAADFGWLFVTRAGRELRVGLGEDLGPNDGSIDLVVKFGVGW